MIIKLSKSIEFRSIFYCKIVWLFPPFDRWLVAFYLASQASKGNSVAIAGRSQPRFRLEPSLRPKIKGLQMFDYSQIAGPVIAFARDQAHIEAA
jgi:hypothetical protein